MAAAMYVYCTCVNVYCVCVNAPMSDQVFS